MKFFSLTTNNINFGFTNLEIFFITFTLFLFLTREEGNAWTASNNDFDQQLIIDLGSTMNVTRIWTRGRPHSNEFVEQYGISYGSNGRDYAAYKDPDGSIKVRTQTKTFTSYNYFLFNI